MPGGAAAGSAASAAERRPDLAADPLVFQGVKSAHSEGCYASGGAFLLPDGTAKPLRSKASNRCPGCARAAAYEAMTMLRIDAEENSAPGYVLTLTSREPVSDSRAYRVACAQFWKAWRKRWGPTEYCGFVEWTTGKARTSGGLRRLHTHWLVKAAAVLDVAAVESWCSTTWARLWNGSWRVQLAELHHAGGVVGYLALHHEKMEQAPPKGWTGRRLRPSGGYFAVDGATRLARARLWLAEHRESREEWPRPFGPEKAARLVWGTTESEKAARVLTSRPGRGFDSLPERVALDRRLLDPEAPINVDHLSALAQDEAYHAAVVRSHYRRRRLAERTTARLLSEGPGGAMT